ncbi:MAG TPA: DUF1549 domain-containing protein, partial [Candidatus Binatia bacterium]|nr:DUF1549 domain-containing protein [Candidatus Binatia bacterium]
MDPAQSANDPGIALVFRKMTRFPWPKTDLDVRSHKVQRDVPQHGDRMRFEFLIRRPLAVWLGLWLGAQSMAGAAADPASAGLEFFEKKIRPLLVAHCYQCHSAESKKSQGGLLLDSIGGLLKGGESGPAIVPGAPDRSLLLKTVRQKDRDLHLQQQHKKLSDRQVAQLVQWVRMGAPWPGTDPAKSQRPVKTATEIRQKDRAWWAFQPIHRPPAPLSNLKSPISNPIDAFVVAELEANGLRPNPPAAKRELIRRVYFDLIGLPPTPEQVAAFEQDPSPDAWENLVDHLLSLPQYGERWARHWLDVVRFAQSNGYERDGEKPYAWRYRDYVVQALNQDKPYDQFIR